MVKRVKNILGAFPFIGRSQSQKGTISTASPSQKAASAFVKRRKQLGGPRSVMPVKKAMGGTASEGAARGRIFAAKKERDRARLMDMLERLKKGDKKSPKTLKPKKKPKMERPIMPKDKPKKDSIRPILPKDFKKPKMKRAK